MKRKAPNPTGKGGFKDNPQNSARGYWSKENSVPYYQKIFLKMHPKDFESYLINNPDATMAAKIAHASVVSSFEDFKHHKDLIDRTSGTATQHIEQSTTIDIGQNTIQELRVNITGDPKYIVEGN